MKRSSRPLRVLAQCVALLAGAIAILPPHPLAAQSGGLTFLWHAPSRLLHGSTQGYMGVLIGDVDSDAASRLKLRENRGALVTLIDHDAPAAQAGIRVNDVILQINGQPVENAEQFGRTLKPFPPGRKISLLVARDGNTQTIVVELADHKKIEHDAWNKLENGDQTSGSSPWMGILPGSGGGADAPSPAFHLPTFGSTLNVGALVEPLTSQMSEYLGVPGGLMIKQVTRKSDAAVAGLKSLDIILRVGSDTIATLADWDRALRSNQNRTVIVIILRDRRQQTVNLEVDSKHSHS